MMRSISFLSSEKRFVVKSDGNMVSRENEVVVICVLAALGVSYGGLLLIDWPSEALIGY